MKLETVFPELEPPQGGLFSLKAKIQRDLAHRRRRFFWALGVATAAVILLVQWPQPELETPRLLDDTEMRALGIGDSPGRVSLALGQAVKLRETETVVVYNVLVPRKQQDPFEDAED